MALSFAEFFGAHQTQLDTWLDSINGQSAATTLAFNTLATDGGTTDTTPPTFTSAGTANAVENQNVLYDADATDTSLPLVYGLGGADAGLLNINPSTGIVTLKTGNLDFESTKTSYNFSVTATDAAAVPNIATQAITVTVTNDPSDDDGGAVQVDVTAANNGTTHDAAPSDFEYNFAAGNYTYTITNFNDGDILDFPDTAVPSVINDTFGDGSVLVQWGAAGNTMQIQLTGLAAADDSFLLTSVDGFNTVFGAGSLI